MIGLFCIPLTPIASEQHSSLAPSLKLALLRRSVKINVVQKQQHLMAAQKKPPGSSILDPGIQTSRRMQWPGLN